MKQRFPIAGVAFDPLAGYAREKTQLRQQRSQRWSWFLVIIETSLVVFVTFVGFVPLRHSLAGQSR
jgi:hypothetical protein